ncbi:MAG: helix-turn-helix domain-containing protein [Selenomonas artemidis]
MINIPNRLRHIRKQHCLTQAELAEKLKLPLRSYQNYEGGQTKLPAEELYKLIVLLNISADEFFERPRPDPLQDLRNEISTQHEEILNLLKDLTNTVNPHGGHD